MSKPFLMDEVFMFPPEERNQEIKAVFFNINGLLFGNHKEDLRSDHNLLQADLICLAETKLHSGIPDDVLRLDNFEMILRSDFSAKTLGMIVYQRLGTNCSVSGSFTSQEHRVQIIKIKLDKLSILFTYIHPEKTVEGLKILANTAANQDCILGDINIDTLKEGGRKKLDAFCIRLNVFRHLQDVTHRGGGQLDQVLIPTEYPFKVFSAAYFNLYSDHKAVTVRISDTAEGFKQCWLKVEEVLADSPPTSVDEQEEVLNLDQGAERTQLFDPITRIRIMESAMKTLDANSWLNDEIINVYMSLVARSQYAKKNTLALSSFFYETLSHHGKVMAEKHFDASKNMDLSDYDLVLVPIH